jgi:hypothetical protein
MSSNYRQSFGSSNKIKGVLDQALVEMGFDPELAHGFTVLWTDQPNCEPRILLTIEPRK